MSELTLNLNKDYVNLLKELKVYISSAILRTSLPTIQEIEAELLKQHDGNNNN